MKSPVRFGFVGAGAVSHWSARVVTAYPHGRLVAAQDFHAVRLKELCDEFSIPHAFATAEELFACEEVDAVYIAVPNKFHVPLTIQALEAGKHVILEKPFALSAEEAATAVEASKRAGKVLTLGMNQRFTKEAQKFRVFAAQGVFGNIYHAKAYWLRRSGIPKLGTWFGSKDLAGGGCLYDIGVHVLDLCLFLMDNFEPVSVYGATYSEFGNRGLGEGCWGRSHKEDIPFEVEDFATGIIRLANGATVGLDVSWARFAEENERFDVELFGTEGGGQLRADKIFRRDGQLGSYYTIEKAPFPDTVSSLDRFHNLIQHLLEGEQLCVTLDQALTVQKILDALESSARTGQSVSL